MIGVRQRQDAPAADALQRARGDQHVQMLGASAQATEPARRSRSRSASCAAGRGCRRACRTAASPRPRRADRPSPPRTGSRRRRRRAPMVGSAGATMVCSSAERNIASRMPAMMARIAAGSSGAAVCGVADSGVVPGADMRGAHCPSGREFQTGTPNPALELALAHARRPFRRPVSGRHLLRGSSFGSI
jgi:hypothetical protein